MDYDDLIGDDLIGEVEIDIESRYFDEKFMSTEHYPVEKLLLRSPESKVPTGAIRMWVEISLLDLPQVQAKLDQSRDSNESATSRGEAEKASLQRVPWNISLMPPGDYELRVIIWEVHDCPLQDTEQMSDIFVRCKLPSYNDKLLQETDTHIRSEGFVDSTTNQGFFQLADDFAHQIRRVHRQEEVRFGSADLGQRPINLKRFHSITNSQFLACYQ